jgi:hypothetical protein
MKDQTFYIIELDGVLQPMHYNTYNEAYNGIIAAFKEKPEIKYGSIAEGTYKDLNVTIKNH